MRKGGRQALVPRKDALLGAGCVSVADPCSRRSATCASRAWSGPSSSPVKQGPLQRGHQPAHLNNNREAC